MVRTPTQPAASGSGSSIRVVRFCLRHRGKNVPLESGQYTIGRGATCDVVLDDVHVSRLHARLLVNDTTAVLEDIRSEHGVFVNEERIRRSVRLNDGDRIIIGDQEIAFLVDPVDGDPRSSGTIEVAAPSSAPWRTARRLADGTPSTLEADAFQYLGSIAERMLMQQRGGTAERLLQGHLEEVFEAARTTGVVPRDIADAAAVNAIRLALGLRKGAWVDFVIELHSILRTPPCSAVTSGLRAALRQLSGFDHAKWGEYERLLKVQMPAMLPDDLDRARAFMWIEKP